VVREAIASGRLQGGCAIREVALAEELEVSRTPVREALRRLTAEGLIEREERRGVRVAKWDPEEVDEIFSLRVDLESHAAALAARRAGPDDVSKFELLADEMAEAVERFVTDPSVGFELVADLNGQFHTKIVEVAGNHRLASIVQVVVQRALVERVFHGYTSEEFRRSCGHHREVADAIAAGDGEWARAAMRTHILAGRQVALREAAGARSGARKAVRPIPRAVGR